MTTGVLGRALGWAGERRRAAGASELRAGRVDLWLLGVTLVLVAFGLVMMYSASATIAQEDLGDSFYYVKRQGVSVLVGLLGLAVFSRMPSRLFSAYAWAFYGASVLGLVLVFVPSLGHTTHGATRWIGSGSLHIQPSEFAKLAVILVLAHELDRHPGRVHEPRQLVRLLAAAGFVMVLLLKEPDFGTTAIVAALLGFALYLGGLSWLWIGSFGVVGALGGLGLVLASSYRKARLVSWLDPWASAQGDGYQVIQSWLALASGGWTGVGLGNSIAKQRFLPEPWTDFVAAVVGEELGLLGFLGLLALYGLLAWRGIRIAMRTRTYFGRLVAASITALLGAQAAFNLAVVLGLVPPKGLVLPFVSYGASAVVAQLWAVGVLLSLSVEVAPAREVG